MSDVDSRGSATSPGPHGAPGPRVGGWEVLAFGCELAMLAAFAVIGWRAGTGLVVQVILAVLLPTIVGTGWGLWLAPASARRLSAAPLLVTEVAVFVLAGIGLAAVGAAGWGAALVVVSLGDLLVSEVRSRP